jgi:uncharacterized membrane protein (UPF0127 family)
VPSSFLAPLLADPERPARLMNERTGGIVATRIEPAWDSSTRRRGLLGRDRLEAGTAMILAPCSSVHTFFMRFPIDVVHVARDGRVLRIRESVRPWRVSGSLRAYATIELAAGSVRSADLRVTDRLAIELEQGLTTFTR